MTGRPRLPEATRKGAASLQIRLTPAEVAAIDAARGGLTRAEWARRIILPALDVTDAR